MPRRAFYSFHYEPDNWRAASVRNMGVLEGNRSASDNDWESIKRGGDAAIQRWINDQLYGKTVTILLIGANTSGRKWINYEIKKSWELRKGIFGIYIHNLEDRFGRQSLMGRNPFGDLQFAGAPFANIVKAYNPPYAVGKNVYGYISQNMPMWIEESIVIRNKYG